MELSKLQADVQLARLNDKALNTKESKAALEAAQSLYKKAVNPEPSALQAKKKEAPKKQEQKVEEPNQEQETTPETNQEEALKKS